MPAPRKQKSKSAKKGAPKTRCTKMKQLTPGEWFEKLVAVQARLRAPEGCPWDREQTHQSLRANLLEEAYEVLEAIDADDPDAMTEEFGDLLLQVVLHSQIALEAGEFTLAEIIAGLRAKLIRRHP